VVRDESADRVIVGACGSPGSIRALRFAAGVAATRGALLIPVLAWMPPGGDLADRRYPSPYLRGVWREAAQEQLTEAVGLAFGAEVPEVTMAPAVIRGDAGRVLVSAADGPGDLLVIGTGSRGAVRRLLPAGVARYCVGHAECPVIAVPPSELAEAARGLRGWALRHRALRPEAAALS
jgi:nucleotide-binding universal stress UspA family protein